MMTTMMMAPKISNRRPPHEDERPTLVDRHVDEPRPADALRVLDEKQRDDQSRRRRFDGDRFGVDGGR
jgi:hypothetical protein